MPIKVTSKPATLALSLDDAKQHLNYTEDDQDDYIEALCFAAVETVENFTGRSLISQTLTLKLDGFPSSREILLERCPIQSVTSVSYLDNLGQNQTLSASKYTVDTHGEPGRISLNDGQIWPSTKSQANAVSIEYVSGYGDLDSAIPAQLKLALKLLVAHYFQNRDIVSAIDLKEIPKSFEFLLLPFRVFSWRG